MGRGRGGGRGRGSKQPVLFQPKTPVTVTQVLRSEQEILNAFDAAESQSQSQGVLDMAEEENVISLQEVVKAEIYSPDPDPLCEYRLPTLVNVADILEQQGTGGDEEQQETGGGKRQPGTGGEEEQQGKSGEEEVIDIDADPIQDNDRQNQVIEDLTDISSTHSEGEDETNEHEQMTKTGRKKSAIWKDFETKHDGKKVISNKCKRCKMEVSDRPTRMANHLLHCKKSIQETRKKLGVTARSVDLPCSSSSTSTSPSFPSKASIQQSMKKWVQNCDAEGSKKWDAKIGKFFFGTNIAFRKVDSTYFHDLFKGPRPPPGYVPPSAKRLKTTVLNKQYDECTETLKEKLQGKKVVIIQDGWSTNQNDPVISHCLHGGDQPVFFDAIATEANRKTAHYCFQLMENAIQHAQTSFGCVVVGVVTDNCNVMRALQKLVAEKYPDMFVYGCHAHIFNLLGQDLTVGDVIEKVNKVQKFFRNHHFESSTLKNLHGKRPVLPVSTRWNSQIDSLRNYKENHTKYLEIKRMDCSNVRKEVELSAIIEDPNIYSEVVSLISNLEPIAIELDKAQSDTCMLADAFSMWKKLGDQLILTFDEQQKFDERKELACPPVAIAAYMMHPLYKGEGLTRQEQEVGFNFLDKKSTMLIALVANLKAGDELVFPKHLLRKETVECMRSNAWWRSMEGFTTISKSLIDYCESLMLLPASTAAIERSFSTLGDILTKKRNRLAIERAKKLCVVYKTLSNSQPDNKSDESDIDE